jgi:Cu+-exporting ATPase
MGRVTVAEVWFAPSFPEVDAVSVVGALADGSNHPLSQAVAAWAKDLAKEGGTTRAMSNWEELRGRGVTAKFADSQDGTKAFRLGSLEWLAESGAEARVAGVAEFVKRFTAQGATVIGLARDHHLVAVFALRDELKPAANDVIRELKGQGLKAYLVTGDRHETAAAIAERAGIPAVNVFAGVRPEQKAEIVQKLQACGERVAFIGDGINDAPALEQADLGIAVSRASDVAREAADIILLKSDIQAVPEALGLARATLRTIKQNLFWAFFYNAAAIPLAALGFLSPVICAATMGFSDVLVIGNALRLLRWRAR